MVSKEELVYHFTDIYLSAAMDCSICKENYEMTDDKEFLDDYLKLFSLLLISIQDDKGLSVSDKKEILREKRDRKFEKFHLFMRQKIAEEAVEAIGTQRKIDSISQHKDNSAYVEEIAKYMDEIYDEECVSLKNDPVGLLKKIREKEENYRIEG